MPNMQVSRFWRHFKEKYRLVGSKCKKCGKIHFPQGRCVMSVEAERWKRYSSVEEERSSAGLL